MGASALVLGPTLGQIGSWFAPRPEPELFGIPQDWITALGGQVRGYVAFLAGLQLKKISVRQIIEPHMKERGGVRSGLPPAGLWMSMKPTLLVADEVAIRLGEKVETVISAYRSPAYNARCPGAAAGSQHMRNIALDLVFSSSPSKVARVARDLRREGRFRGGVGVYPGFTHMDTRGANADWGRA